MHHDFTSLNSDFIVLKRMFVLTRYAASNKYTKKRNTTIIL